MDVSRASAHRTLVGKPSKGAGRHRAPTSAVVVRFLYGRESGNRRIVAIVGAHEPRRWTIKKPVEGRFSPLQRSAIPLLVGPRLQRQGHRLQQQPRDPSGRTPLRQSASGLVAVASSRAALGLQQRLVGGLQGEHGDRARRAHPRRLGSFHCYGLWRRGYLRQRG